MAFPTLNILCTVLRVVHGSNTWLRWRVLAVLLPCTVLLPCAIGYTDFRKLCMIHTETIAWLLLLSVGPFESGSL